MKNNPWNKYETCYFIPNLKKLWNLISRETKTRNCGCGSPRPYCIFKKYIYTVKSVQVFTLKDTYKQM